MNARINRIHERALRLVYNDYTLILLKKDESISIHHRNIHYTAIEMYKVKNGLSPSFMNELFQVYNGPSTRSGKLFVKPRVNTVYKGENSLRCFGPTVWDDILPDKFKDCGSLSEFKNALKSWVPENCSCRLCKIFVRGLGFVTVED